MTTKQRTDRADRPQQRGLQLLMRVLLRIKGLLVHSQEIQQVATIIRTTPNRNKCKGLSVYVHEQQLGSETLGF